MATAGASRGAGPERAYHHPLPAAGVVRLSADESHHLVRARRVAVGDEVVLFDGVGATRAGRVVATGRDGADVEVVGPAPDRAPHREVVVATAWPEGARADDLVATLAELGVAAVVPVRTARAQEDVADRVDRRRERYTRLAIEAAITAAPALPEWRAPASCGDAGCTSRHRPGAPAVATARRAGRGAVGPEGGSRRPIRAERAGFAARAWRHGAGTETAAAPPQRSLGRPA
jgi:hypothetical protein